jgi:hypothetical protein
VLGFDGPLVFLPHQFLHHGEHVHLALVDGHLGISSRVQALQARWLPECRGFDLGERRPAYFGLKGLEKWQLPAG